MCGELWLYLIIGGIWYMLTKGGLGAAILEALEERKKTEPVCDFTVLATTPRATDERHLKGVLKQVLIKPIRKHGKACENAGEPAELLRLMAPDKIKKKATASIQEACRVLRQEGYIVDHLTGHFEPLWEALDAYAPQYNRFFKRWRGQFAEGCEKGSRGAEAGRMIGRHFGTLGEIGGIIVGGMLAINRGAKEIESAFDDLGSSFTQIGELWGDCALNVGNAVVAMSENRALEDHS